MIQSASNIPTGFRIVAQGCGNAATLGSPASTLNPKGVASGYGRFMGMLRNPVGVENHNRKYPRVAAFAATLGFMP
ncbi:MAG: hypothetical protein WC799_09025 [Desulfobacteraceae bacterium]